MITNLPACLEIKDQDEEPKAVVAQVIEGGDLKIEEPLYLIEGEFLRESETPNTEKSQSPPRDYEYRFSNLEIGPKGVLYTLGNNVRIHVENFTVFGGVIASFPENQKSIHGDGRSGGHLMLWAQNAEGNLKVIMRGEQGKQGDPGNPPDESLKGFPGPAGKSREVVGQDEGGTVLTLPEPGEQGYAGKKGFTGKQGKSGGNSGTLEFTAIQNKKLYLAVELLAGLSGMGGIGGAGGAGGDGGLGGEYRTRDHKRAPSGPPGPPGPNGDPGIAGISGLVETACVTVAGVMECKSENFNYSK
jgi:hypothetical protein